MLGFFPRRLDIYQQALVHKSSSVKLEGGRLLNNERLEFLGDAVLDAVVADILYCRFEGKREGFLTSTRSKIVQRETLNHVASQIGLDKLVKSSTQTTSHHNHMGGNAFEALVGAIYVDRGYAACKRFMEKRILGRCLDIDQLVRQEVNFKSRLIEWGQKGKCQVSFELIEQSTDEGAGPTFRTKVLIEGLPGGVGVGYNKKESQQNASQAALRKLRQDSRFAKAVRARRQERLKAVCSSAEADAHSGSLND
ncbi:MAG: ribonuclease III [Bacteroidaceae bacterium]